MAELMPESAVLIFFIYRTSERDNMRVSQLLCRRERVKTGGGPGMGLSHPSHSH